MPNSISSVEVPPPEIWDGIAPFVGEISDPEIRDYLAEAGRCAKVQCFRAAAVMAWAGITHALRKTIEFIQGNTGRKTVEGAVRQAGIKSWKPSKGYEKLWDAQLLSLCNLLGVVSDGMYRKLDDFRQQRHLGAHPAKDRPFQYAVIGMAELLATHVATGREGAWAISEQMVDRIVAYDWFDLDEERARRLMRYTREEVAARMSEHLLDVYLDPEWCPVPPAASRPLNGMVDRDDRARQGQVRVLVQTRIPILWKALAAAWPTQREAMTAKLASKIRVDWEMAGQVEWRRFIWPDALTALDQDSRSLIVTIGLDEAEAKLNSGLWGHEYEHLLAGLSSHAQGEDLNRAQDLLKRIRQGAIAGSVPIGG